MPALFAPAGVAPVAREILARGLWCVVEVCVDVSHQRWEPRMVICELDADAVLGAIITGIELALDDDVRLVGYRRDDLVRVDEGPIALCHVAGVGLPPRPRMGGEKISRGRQHMQVRDGMNEILVTVGPEHTLGEAARRMHAHGVGAAVVIDSDQQGPGILTERDLLGAAGRGLDLHAELVRDHLSSRLVYAAADWSLERAAEEMTRGGFRHVIVLDGSDVVGILSMRDIVRCWVTDGAACDVGEPDPPGPDR